MSKREADLLRQIQENKNKYNKYYTEHSIHSFKSEYVGCKNCGSKLKISLVKGEVCPLCRKDLRSSTTLETLARYKNKDTELNKKLAVEQAKARNTSKVSKSKALSPQQAAYNEVCDTVDYILEEHRTPDFIEVIGKMGGDVLRFRIMRDGNVYEK